MHLLQVLLVVGVGSTILFSVANASPNPKCYSQIVWQPCQGAPAFQCGTYEVPLDYARPHLGSVNLALAKVNATREPKLGTIFVNPGGPGNSGVAFVQNPVGFLPVTNGQYDVIGWDPRGIGQTSPKFSCGFSALSDVVAFLNGSILDVGFEAHGNFTDKKDLSRFFAGVPAAESLFSKFEPQCLSSDSSFLKYSGTTSVVKDIVAMADCIDGPSKPINFLGVSYGTVIGNYLVNMYPERVGRVVIDGVVDSIDWATAPSYKFFDDSLRDADAVFSNFSRLCAAAGPAGCAFAQEGSTESSLVQDFRDIIDTAYQLHMQGQTNITSFQIRAFVYGLLASPNNWAKPLAPQLAAWRQDLKTGNLPLSLPDSLGSTDVQPDVQQRIGGIVIRCLDSRDQYDIPTSRVFQEIVRVTQDESTLFGLTSLKSIGEMICQKFNVRDVDRFHGPFNRRLANPILVVTNTGDPLTPLEGAQKIASTLGHSARLLIQDGFGHTSTAQVSSCTVNVVRSYLLNNTLPPVGHVCPVDVPIFPIVQA